MSDTSLSPSIRIRNACATDEAAVLDICLRTADRGHDGTHCYSDPRLPGFVWALPYLRICPENAFVITCDDVVMGYCVAASDTVLYEDHLEAEWWPMLMAELQNFSATTVQDGNVLAYIRNAPRTPPQITAPYPAHLHINLLPALQKGGHGAELIHHQLQSLCDAGACGVHLGIDPRNEGVMGFYSKFGFAEIDRTPSIVMGKSLV